MHSSHPIHSFHLNGHTLRFFWALFVTAILTYSTLQLWRMLETSAHNHFNGVKLIHINLNLIHILTYSTLQLQRPLSLLFFKHSSFILYYIITCTSCHSLHITGINWTRTWPASGKASIAQSVKHRIGIAEVMGLNPLGASEFFLGYICNCLSYFKTAKISFISILYLQFTHMIFIMYTSSWSFVGQFWTLSQTILLWSIVALKNIISVWCGWTSHPIHLLYKTL